MTFVKGHLCLTCTNVNVFIELSHSPNVRLYSLNTFLNSSVQNEIWLQNK